MLIKIYVYPSFENIHVIFQCGKVCLASQTKIIDIHIIAKIIDLFHKVLI